MTRASSARAHPPHGSEAVPVPLALMGRLGSGALDIAGGVGRASLFLVRAVEGAVRPPYRWGLIIEQLHFIGNRSVGIIALTSAFTGLVLALQGYNALSRFGAEQLVGSLVALSLVRELAPVLGALMVTARAGSAVAATMGNMRVTEQIDALKSMAIDPFGYLVAPRVVAALVAGPMLTAMFTLTGLGVAQVFSVHVLRLDAGAFNHSVSTSIKTGDVVEGLSKALVFAVAMIWIATYRGYHARGGAQGVGQATTRAVVETSVLVLALDYVLTALLF
ncbi:MAG: MlaE family lipid ABC transporter permease subunit [Myxococcales bacterium]|nr:MlaE family lipid ABC transporter permease subunit [Myxococcales bacterium]